MCPQRDVKDYQESPKSLRAAWFWGNLLTENAIRPFVIGRKNFLFCDTVAGANTSANLYSLIETAKANDLEPHAYLKMVFTELPKATSLQDIEALLPYKRFDTIKEAA